MPLTLSLSIPSQFKLTVMSIRDRGLLIKALAALYLTKADHARKIINALSSKSINVQKTVYDGAISNLEYLTPEIQANLLSSDTEARKKAEDQRDARQVHRDGLLFQNISWLAATMEHPGCRATPPHVRKADKGFDGFLIEATSLPSTIPSLVLCEDKATDSPRSTIRDKVFPELESLSRGERDLEIMQEVTQLILDIPEAEREDLLSSITWEQIRRFRISVTAAPGDSPKGNYENLFKDYEVKAPGKLEVRQACVMPLTALRSDLENIANDVINELKKMRAAQGV